MFVWDRDREMKATVRTYAQDRTIRMSGDHKMLGVLKVIVLGVLRIGKGPDRTLLVAIYHLLPRYDNQNDDPQISDN